MVAVPKSAAYGENWLSARSGECPDRKEEVPANAPKTRKVTKIASQRSFSHGPGARGRLPAVAARKPAPEPKHRRCLLARRASFLPMERVDVWSAVHLAPRPQRHPGDRAGAARLSGLPKGRSAGEASDRQPEARRARPLGGLGSGDRPA